MPEQPDEQMLREIHDVGRQLAERQGLSDDETDEICGHLEDKLLGYLRGEVRITREDALLLARAHFGDVAGVTRQLAYHGDPPRPERVRSRMLVRTSVFTAIATLVALPGTLLLFGEPPTTLRGLLMGGAVLLGCLLIIESGVLLAGLTNPQSRWQRIVAGTFILPALTACYLALVAGLRAFGANWRLPTQGGYAVIVAIVLVCLLGHALLLFLLALPVRETNEQVARL